MRSLTDTEEAAVDRHLALRWAVNNYFVNYVSVLSAIRLTEARIAAVEATDNPNPDDTEVLARLLRRRAELLLRRQPARELVDTFTELCDRHHRDNVEGIAP